MEKYCICCKRNTAIENSSVKKTKENKLMVLSNYVICGKKELIFIKNQELHNFNNI